MSTGVTVARAFTDAVNAHAHDEAAQLLANDVVLVFPGARLEGREGWLESRRRQQPPEHLVENVEVDRIDGNEDGAELNGRLVQRWTESGEVASEMPIRIAFTVADGAITRLEFTPLSA
jgi:SnoaL-like protein